MITRFSLSESTEQCLEAQCSNLDWITRMFDASPSEDIVHRLRVRDEAAQGHHGHACFTTAKTMKVMLQVQKVFLGVY